jgi:ABC-type phosphate transport system auxiliary subunit
MDGTLSTDGNVFDAGLGGASAAGTVTTVVRGDGVASDGLLKGDVNRDWVVNGSDFALLGGNWQQAGGWDQGDFNIDGQVNGSDFALLGGNWQQSATPPLAAGAVPEPSSIALLCLISVLLVVVRRGK